MGPADRNPDNIAHARVTFLEEGRAVVGFEDQFGGGDRDFNDNEFEFRGGVEPQPPKEPVADAGPDQSVVEGSVVTLDGTGSTDPDSENLTYLWAPVGQSGPPIALTSATSATPTFQTTDDGTYRFSLTVSDGTESDTDEVVVEVTNAVPVLSAEADPAYAGGVALVTASFTDAGILDTHSAKMDWGDGSPVVPAPVASQGAGWGTVVGSHVFATAGTYTVTVTITDDDGGVAKTTVAGLQVAVPVALWANSSAADTAMESTSGAVSVEGLSHTNDDLRLRGDTKTFHGPVEYVRTLDVGGGGAVFDQPATRTAVKPFPFRYAVGDYRPGGRGGAWRGRRLPRHVGKLRDRRLLARQRRPTREWHLLRRPAGPRSTATRSAGPSHSSPRRTSRSRAAARPSIRSPTGCCSSAPAARPAPSGSTRRTRRSSATRSPRRARSSSPEPATATTAASSPTGSTSRRADLLVRGSGCGRPVHTNARPTIVPSLAVDIVASVDDGLAGGPLRHTATITNSGATLVVPGVIGLENLATSGSPVGVTGHDLHLEYRSVTDGLWHPLPGTITFAITPNAFAGVSYPAGPERIDGTAIGPRALASWGYAAVVRLDPDQTTLLLDPNRTAGVRAVSTFTVSPADAPVRRLFRFGDDLSAAIVAAGATATDVAVTIIPPSGDPRAFSAPTTAGLGSLAPGASVAVTP